MNPNPAKIDQCPILEAIFEVKFKSLYPVEAVFGIFYKIIDEIFNGAKLINLPILQLPEAVRQADPSLTYQPHYKMQKENHVINIGPRVLIFSNRRPYKGWENWHIFIESVLKKLTQSKVFQNIERCGLRYINLFDEEIFTIANIKLTLIDDTINPQSTIIRTDILDGDLVKVIQISNNVSITQDDNKFVGSILDIDVINQLNMNNDEFDLNLSAILKIAHDKEKELFFNLLKKEYISTLVPHYCEG